MVLLFEESDIVSWGAVRCAIGAAAAALALAPLDTAMAQQGRLDARYAATLAGIPIGKGAWVIELADTHFTAAASGVTSGLLSVIATGRGTGASRGAVIGGKLVPSSFASSITSDRKTEDVRMTLGSGDVRDFEITPPPEGPPDPERLPVTEAHRHGVTDPMTAALVRVPGSGNPVTPKLCERTAQIFDGRLRYNLHFAYKRMEQVKAEKGYAGPAVVCAVYFVPVAGYVPSRSGIKYLARQRDMEMWFAPIGSTRVLVPYRTSVPTPVGLGVVEATQFVALPSVARTTAGVKTQ
jgi:hypothetical protein